MDEGLARKAIKTALVAEKRVARYRTGDVEAGDIARIGGSKEGVTRTVTRQRPCLSRGPGCWVPSLAHALELLEEHPRWCRLSNTPNDVRTRPAPEVRSLCRDRVKGEAGEEGCATLLGPLPRLFHRGPQAVLTLQLLCIIC